MSEGRTRCAFRAEPSGAELQTRVGRCVAGNVGPDSCDEAPQRRLAAVSVGPGAVTVPRRVHHRVFVAVWTPQQNHVRFISLTVYSAGSVCFIVVSGAGSVPGKPPIDLHLFVRDWSTKQAADRAVHIIRAAASASRLMMGVGGPGAAGFVHIGLGDGWFEVQR